MPLCSFAAGRQECYDADRHYRRDGCTAPSPTAAPRLDGRQLVAYYPQWGVYDRKHFVKNTNTSGSADEEWTDESWS
jgi:hypothetical protein